MAQKKHKHKGLPKGMTYADKLAKDRMVKEAVEKAAQDTSTRLRAEIQSQQRLWLFVVAMAEAFGLGPKRIQVDFFNTLDNVSEWLEDLTRKHGREYALDKLRQRAEQVSGVPIEYLYEKEIRDAQELHDAKGLYLPLLEEESL